MKTIAERICGNRKYNKQLKRTRWWNEEIKELVKEKKLAWKKYMQTRKQTEKEEYNARRNLVKKAVREAKKNSWRDFGEQITEMHKTDNRKFWTKIKRLRGNKRKEIKAIRNKSNQLQTGINEILETWTEHYTDKFNKHAVIMEEDINREEQEREQDVKMEEIEAAIQKIKTGKAGGEDGIAPEMIKWLGRKGKEWILNMFREAWNKQEIPKDWEENLIVPIYKKGEQTHCENYRAICLAQTIYKLYTRILENRLRRCVECKLEEEQAAFRPKRQTNDNIFIIRNIIERKIGEGGEMYLTFIDLKSAFDAIDRREVWRTLEEMEVPNALVRAIRSVYNTVRARVQIAGRKSEEFIMKNGIKQGDSLSPLLFILIMDKLIKQTKTQTEHLNTLIGYKDLEPVKISSLLYADDVVLIGSSKNKMQKLVNIWTKEIETLKMEINIDKTKVMIINENQDNNSNKDIKCKNKILERVTTYDYLGSIVTNDGKIDAEITNRANKSTKVYYALNKTILGHRDIDIEVKIKIHNVVTLPIITYACENWTLRRMDESKINAIEMKHLRRIAGKTRWDKVKNEDIRVITKQEPIIEKIKKKQLEWYGHVRRMKTGRITKKVMEARSLTTRRRGRPRRKWINQIQEIGREKGKTLEEMRLMSRNRREWKKWIQEEPESAPDT